MNNTRRRLAPPGALDLSPKALQEVGEMTQITRKSVPTRGLILLLAMFLGAGLVLTGCGDDDTATTPAPAPPPPPPPPPAPEPEPEPEPEPPATPTGLMVSATTIDSITWTWNAVEGAIGYAVQVSADEMFDATDTIHPAAAATFTASPLPPETSVFVRVAAAGGTLEAPILSAWTTHVTGMSAMPPPPPPAPDPPGMPTGLMVSEVAETSITWTWDEVEGATGYSVQVSSDEMFDDTDATHETTETTFTASDLAAETTMFVRVAATSDAGMGAWSTHVTGVSAAAPAPPPPPAPPGMPSGLMVSETTQTSITWTWNEVEGATGYSVQVSSDEVFDDTDMTHTTTETSYTASDLEPDTDMVVRVAATSDAGSSDWTTHVTGMSQMVPPPPPLVAPDAPGGLTGVGVDDTSITWSWDEVMGADGYQVQVNSADDFAGVDAMNIAETSYTQTDLSAGTTSHLRVRATVGSGDRMAMSEWTAHRSATTRIPPAMPMNLTATAGDGSITWTWDEAEHADSYDVQISTNGVFLPGMEMTSAETNSHTVDGLDPGTSAYVRVRASSGTGDQARLTSGWTAPMQGASTEIPIPPAPTGLTAASGDGSITWSWDEVEGATGYQVQVSDSEDFSGAETMDVEAGETSHSVDVEAGTTRYLRVRATGMGDPSGWATHATGMSNAPPEPEPEAPDPIVVAFSVGEDDGDPMEPDDGTDKEKAMAEVNAKMVVSSNYTAAITPMFVEDAAAVTVAAGDNNMPFSYVDWEALQSDVVDGGVTFMIQKTAMGANQEMEPTGDVAYVTCGPFECVSGDTAPTITSMDDDSYVAWDPMLDISYGWVDNDVFDDDAGDNEDPTADDGIDLGWVTSSTLGMGVKHIFNGVPDGRNFSVTGPDAAGDKNAKATALSTVVDGVADDADTDDVDESETNNETDFNGALTADCILVDETDSPYSYTTTGATVGTAGTEGLLQPDECFKIDAKPDWLSGYSLEFTPKNDGITWGEIGWWDDLEYDAVTIAAADVVTDICELFEDEVDRAFEEDWAADSFDIRNTDPVGDTGGGEAYVTHWEVGPGTLNGRQFKTLWFDDDLDGDFLTADKPKSTDKPAPFVRGGANDLYNEAEVPGNGIQIFQRFIDEDNDPTLGDFGKVDLAGDDPDTDETEADVPDGEADNMTGSQADEDECSMDDNGDEQEEACDAAFEMDFPVFFTDGTFSCETTRTVTVTCEWDAQGLLVDDETPTEFTATPTNAGNIANFANCTAKMN